MNKLGLFFSIFLLFTGCADEPVYDDELPVPGRTTKADPDKGLAISFDCAETGEVADSTALRTIYFLYAENKVALDNIPVCLDVPRKKWKSVGVPKNAFLASGGKWASGAAYYYVEQSGLELIVSKITSDELDGEPGAPVEIYRVKIKTEVQ